MRIVLLLAIWLISSASFASEAKKFEALAMKCNYQAMRNLAYAYQTGDFGAVKSMEKACVWRAAILMSGSKEVDVTDIDNYEIACSRVQKVSKASLTTIDAQQLVRKICK